MSLTVPKIGISILSYLRIFANDMYIPYTAGFTVIKFCTIYFMTFYTVTYETNHW